MNRHFLVASDGSASAHSAMKYLGFLYGGAPDVDVTVLTVAEPLSLYLLSSGTTLHMERDRLRHLDEVEDERTRECARILDRARLLLERQGFPPERIHTKSVPKSGGVVEAIFQEARAGLYDAVVMGRRGLGRLASYFIGSVSYGIIQRLKNMAVWIVDAPPTSKRILVAVDACEPCLQVADHAGFILAGLEGVRVTIFHVIPKLLTFMSREVSASFEDLESVLSEASEDRIRTQLMRVRDSFRQAGFGPEAVEIKIRHGRAGVAGEIASEFEKGGYGTLVVGRRGIGGWEAIFPGSVSNRLLGTLTRGALWIVA